MPKDTQEIEVTLMCSDFGILNEEADKKGISLEEHISNILEQYVEKEYNLSRFLKA